MPFGDNEILISSFAGNIYNYNTESDSIIQLGSVLLGPNFYSYNTAGICNYQNEILYGGFTYYDSQVIPGKYG